jgi:tetratricopeptide (TPR) repeat protein
VLVAVALALAFVPDEQPAAAYRRVATAPQPQPEATLVTPKQSQRATARSRQIAGALARAYGAIKRAAALLSGAPATKLDTRARSKRFDAGITELTRAKLWLGRSGVQRLAMDLATLAKAQDQIAHIDALLVDAHVRLARLFADERNFKRARSHILQALRLDPMHAPALELQGELVKHQIRREESRPSSVPLTPPAPAERLD